jgi:hypothetical protein
MRTLVHRALILVAVGVVSGVLAYVVNARDTTSSTPASQPQRTFSPPESCGAAPFGCRHRAPAFPFGHHGGFDRSFDGGFDGPR